MFERNAGPTSGDVANALCEIGGVLVELNRHDEAVQRLGRAVDIVGPTRSGGAVGRLRHQALLLFGHASVLSGDYRGARAAFSRALRRAEVEGESGEIAAALNGLGMCAKYLGQWEVGLRHYGRAIRIARRAGFWRSEADLLHNLGGIEHARGRFRRAERWAQAGIALRRHHGDSGVPLALDVAALAAIVQGRGQLDAAARLYAQALGVLRARLGARHFEVAFNMAQLAALEHARGRLRRSRTLYTAALPALQRLLGARHPVVARVAANFAVLLGDVGELRRAKALESQALRALESVLGPRHPDVVELRSAVHDRASRRSPV